MSDLSELGGAGGVGAVISGFLVWTGFKSRLDAADRRIEAQDEKIEALTIAMVSPQKCKERGDQCNVHFKGIEDLLQEVRSDIRSLVLRRNSDD